MSATGTTAARAAGPAPGFLRRALRAGPYAWIVWGGVAFFLVNLAALILSVVVTYQVARRRLFARELRRAAEVEDLGDAAAGVDIEGLAKDDR